MRTDANIAVDLRPSWWTALLESDTVANSAKSLTPRWRAQFVIQLIKISSNALMATKLATKSSSRNQEVKIMSSAAWFQILSKKTAQSPASSSRLQMLRRAFMSGVQAYQMATKESGSVVRSCSKALKELLYHPSSLALTKISTTQCLISSSGSLSSAISDANRSARRAAGTSWSNTTLVSLSGTCT